MNDQIVEFVSEVDSTSYDKFNAQAQIESTIELNDEISEYNYSWLSQVEQYLPFVVNIVNTNHKSEDIALLTSYENRLIRTLIFRLQDFLQIEEKRYNKLKNIGYEKRLTSKLTTELDNELICVETKISLTQRENKEKGRSCGMSLEERLQRVISITNSLLDSSFMASLKDTPLVRNPINQTQVLEEETNYRKAYELFHYLDNYTDAGKEYDKEQLCKELDDKLLVASFLEYQWLNNGFKKKKNENVYRAFLERLIEKMVIDSSMDEKSFKKMLNKKFEEEYEKKKNREKNIQNIFLKSFTDYNKQVKDALRALKN